MTAPVSGAGGAYKEITFKPGDPAARALAIKKAEEQAAKTKTENEVFLIDEKAGTITIMDRATFETKAKETGFDPAQFTIDVERADKDHQKAGAAGLTHVDGQEKGGKKGQVDAASFGPAMEALGITPAAGEDPVKAYQLWHNRECMKKSPPDIAGMIKVDGIAKGETLAALQADLSGKVGKLDGDFSAASAEYGQAVTDYKAKAAEYKACLEKAPPDLEKAATLKSELTALEAKIGTAKGKMEAANAEKAKLEPAVAKYFTPEQKAGLDTKLLQVPVADDPDLAAAKESVGKTDAKVTEAGEAKKKEEAKKADLKTKAEGDPSANVRVTIALRGNDGDDVGQALMRCMCEPDPTKWKQGDIDLLREKGVVIPDDVQKMGVGPRVEAYKKVMTDSTDGAWFSGVTDGEKGDGHKFMRQMQADGLLEPFMAKLAEDPKLAKEAMGEHSKGGFLCYVALCSPETAKKFIDMGQFSKEDFKYAAEWIKKNPGHTYDAATLTAIGEGYAKFKDKVPYGEGKDLIEPLQAGRAPGAAAASKPPASGVTGVEKGAGGKVRADIALEGGKTLSVYGRVDGLQFRMGKEKDAPDASLTDLKAAYEKVKSAQDLDKDLQAKLMKQLDEEIKKREAAAGTGVPK